MARFTAAVAVARPVIAIESRSCGRLWASMPKALPSSPSRFRAGTRTLSKVSSAVSEDFMPILWRLRPRMKPGMSASTTSSDRPLRRLSGSFEVRATTITRSALMPPVMKVLLPLRIQSSPSRTAVVVTPARSEPMPGSVIAIALTRAPSAKPGNQRSRCSSLAYSRK